MPSVPAAGSVWHPVGAECLLREWMNGAQVSKDSPHRLICDPPASLTALPTGDGPRPSAPFSQAGGWGHAGTPALRCPGHSLGSCTWWGLAGCIRPTAPPSLHGLGPSGRCTCNPPPTCPKGLPCPADLVSVLKRQARWTGVHWAEGHTGFAHPWSAGPAEGGTAEPGPQSAVHRQRAARLTVQGQA